MAEENSGQTPGLEVSIDSSDAAKGAAEFTAAIDKITQAAEELSVKLTTVAAANKKSLDDLSDSAAKSSKEITVTADSAQQSTKSFQEQSSAVDELKAMMTELSTSSVASLGKLSAALQSITDTLKSLSSSGDVASLGDGLAAGANTAGDAVATLTNQVKDNASTLSGYQNTVDSASSSVDALAQSADSVKNSLGGAETAAQQTTAAFSDVVSDELLSGLNKYAEELLNLQASEGDITKQTEELKDKFAEFLLEQAKLGQSSAVSLLRDMITGENELSESTKKVTGDFTKFLDAQAKLGNKEALDTLAAVRTHLRNVGDGANEAREAMEHLKETGGELKSLFLEGLGIFGLIATLEKATEAATQFQAKTAEILTDINGGKSGLDEYTAGLEQLSKDYGQLPLAEVAAGQKAVSDGYRDSAEALKVVEAANRLAIESGQQLETSQNALISVMKGFKISADDAGHAADVLLVAFKDGRVPLQEMSAILGRLAPQAEAAGVGVDLLASLVSTMTARTGNARLAVQGLQQVFAQLIKPTDEMRLNFQKLTGEQLDLYQASHGTAETLQLIAEKANGSNTALASLFGAGTRTSGVFALLGDGGRTLTEALEGMDHASATANKTFEIMNNTFERTHERLKGQLQQALLDMGNTLIDILSPAVKFLSDHFDGLIAILGAFAAFFAAGKIIAGITAAATALEGFGLVASSTVLSLEALAGPVGWIAAAVTALLLFTRTSNSTSESLDTLKGKLDATTTSFEKMTYAGQATTLDKLNKDLKSAEEQAKKADDAFEQYKLTLKLDPSSLGSQEDISRALHEYAATADEAHAKVDLVRGTIDKLTNTMNEQGQAALAAQQHNEGLAESIETLTISSAEAQAKLSKAAAVTLELQKQDNISSLKDAIALDEQHIAILKAGAEAGGQFALGLELANRALIDHADQLRAAQNALHEIPSEYQNVITATEAAVAVNNRYDDMIIRLTEHATQWKLKQEEVAGITEALNIARENELAGLNSVDSAYNKLIGGTDALITATDKHRDAVAQVNIYLATHKDKTELATRALAVLDAQEAEAAASAKVLSGNLASYLSVADQAANVAKQYGADQASLNLAFAEGKINSDQLATATHNLGIERRYATEAAGDELTMLERVLAKYDQGAGAVAEYTDTIRELNKFVEEHPGIAQQNAGAIAQFQQRASLDLKQKLYESKRDFDAFYGNFETLISGMDQSFVDLWSHGLGHFNDFKDQIKEQFKKFLAELANIAITRPILIKIAETVAPGSSLGIFGKSAGNTNTSGGLLGGLGSAVGGIISSIGSLFTSKNSNSGSSGSVLSSIFGTIGSLFGGGKAGQTNPDSLTNTNDILREILKFLQETFGRQRTLLDTLGNPNGTSSDNSKDIVDGVVGGVASLFNSYSNNSSKIETGSSSTSILNLFGGGNSSSSSDSGTAAILSAISSSQNGGGNSAGSILGAVGSLVSVVKSIGSLFGIGSSGTAAGGGAAGGSAAGGSAAGGSSTLASASWIALAAYIAGSFAHSGYNQGFKAQTKEENDSFSNNARSFYDAGNGTYSAVSRITNILESLGVNEHTANILTGAPGIARLFGYSSPQLRQEDLHLGVSNGEITGNVQSHIHQEGGLFRRDRDTWTVDQLSQQTKDSFNQSLQSIVDSIGQVADQLGASKSTIKNFSAPDTALNLLGVSAEDQGKEISAWLSTVFRSAFVHFADTATGLTKRFTLVIDQFKDATTDDFNKVVAAISTIDITAATTPMQKAAQATVDSQTQLSTAYQKARDTYQQVLNSYDGSVDSLTKLSEAYVTQRQAADDLAKSIYDAGQAIDGMFKTTEQNIKESILSPEDLYNERKSNLDKLAQQLRGSTDVQQVQDLSSQINSLVGTIYNSLDDSQKKQQAGGFVQYLDQINGIAQSILSAQGQTVNNQAKAVDNATSAAIADAAGKQLQAAGQMLQAAQAFTYAAQVLAQTNYATPTRQTIQPVPSTPGREVNI